MINGDSLSGGFYIYVPKKHKYIVEVNYNGEVTKWSDKKPSESFQSLHDAEMYIMDFGLNNDEIQIVQ